MGIKQTLYRAFLKKQNVKIRYYSLSSDEVKYRVLSIYQYEKDFLIAYCHLRKEERTFVCDRIRYVKLLDDKYEIPEGWKPKSKVW